MVIRFMRKFVSTFCRSAAFAGLVLLAAASAAPAAPVEVAEQVAAGNTAYAAGEYTKALAAYDEAEVACPECPQIAYNRGLAYYQMRDFVKAREQFNSALATKDLGLEAQAKYNLGNVAYAQALEKMTAPQEAIELARQAIYHYRDALDLNAQDADARANIETAQLFIKDMLDKQKQEQQQQNQQQNQQDQQQQDQQQQDQQKQDQQQSGDQQQDQQEQDQQQGDQQQQQEQQGEQDQQDQQSQQQQDQAQQSDEQSAAQDQQQQQAQAQDQQPTDQQDAQAAQAEQRKMTDEEVERILQAVRDREAQRREANARKLNARRAPVTRDW